MKYCKELGNGNGNRMEQFLSRDKMKNGRIGRHKRNLAFRCMIWVLE